jgi:hypothetical protein
MASLGVIMAVSTDGASAMRAYSHAGCAGNPARRRQ